MSWERCRSYSTSFSDPYYHARGSLALHPSSAFQVKHRGWLPNFRVFHYPWLQEIYECSPETIATTRRYCHGSTVVFSDGVEPFIRIIAIPYPYRAWPWGVERVILLHQLLFQICNTSYLIPNRYLVLFYALDSVLERHHVGKVPNTLLTAGWSE